LLVFPHHRNLPVIGMTPYRNITGQLGLIVLLPLLLSLVSIAGADDCHETVMIDSVEYTVTDYWCGQMIDSSAIAKPEHLVKLPQELTFEDYRIYVLPQARDAFVKMAEAARKDSVELIVDSGFRSPAFQRRIINKRLASGDSFDEVLNSVAPPGYSEHHTGRAFDLCPSEARFAFTETYRWLKENASRYGFFETLPEDPNAPLTWESWHWTYRGESDSASVKLSPDSADN